MFRLDACHLQDELWVGVLEETHPESWTHLCSHEAEPRACKPVTRRGNYGRARRRRALRGPNASGGRGGELNPVPPPTQPPTTAPPERPKWGRIAVVGGVVLSS